MNTKMNRILMIVAATILTISLLAGVVNANNASLAPITKPSLENVRDFTAVNANLNYAVDGGVLFAGSPQGWVEVKTPDNIVVGAVAADPNNPATLYVGAANVLVVYRTQDNGRNWLRVPLSEEYVGGVTDLAVDSVQHLVYVGTDTAGLYRLRDVGSSMTIGGHLSLDEPVVEVVATHDGMGMVFARTQKTLYRGENYGVNWQPVENLGTSPTALAISNDGAATVYVGTTDRGLLKSQDGLTWTTANAGLGMVPGSRLMVDALAVDPQQPNVIYVATSYLYGSSELHQSPVGVAMSTDGSQSFAMLHADANVAVAELMPVAGQTGAVYAVSNVSRTPQALGSAPLAPAEMTVAVQSEPTSPLADINGLVAWIIASLAALALVYAIVNDLRNRRPTQRRPLADNPARHG